MVYWLLVLIITFILDIITSLGFRNRNKDLEIIILRQQVRILHRKVMTPPRISDPERMILAILVDKFSQSTKDSHQRLNQVKYVKILSRGIIFYGRLSIIVVDDSSQNISPSDRSFIVS